MIKPFLMEHMYDNDGQKMGWDALRRHPYLNSIVYKSHRPRTVSLDIRSVNSLRNAEQNLALSNSSK